MAQPLDQGLDGWWSGGLLGDPDEEVEVVGEDAPGEDLHPAEGGVFPEEGAEFLPFPFLEGMTLLHDTGDAVVTAGLLVGSRPESRYSHVHHSTMAIASCAMPSPSLNLGIDDLG